MSRVAVTGLGVVCCLGNDVPTFWRRLIAGESGIAPITKFDPAGLRNQEAGEVTDFDWSVYSSDPVDEATQYAFAATKEALQDSGLAGTDCTPANPGLKVAVVMSTNFGGVVSWEQYVASTLEGDGGDDARNLQEFDFHRAAEYVATRLELSGLAITLSNSCSSGVSAMGVAADQIRRGRADVVVAGGYDGLGIFSLSGLSILRTITAEKCRPFDKNRSGTIFGEGAGVLILEDMEHALRRGAHIYGELLGYSLNNNAYHLTAPDKGGAGMVQVLRRALHDARAQPQEIDYINAHGTGTQYHDVAETQAIKAVLGHHAYVIPVSSIKAAVSHTMGAAGVIESIATLLAMRDSIAPPTINYETPDPECDLDVAPNHAREHAMRTTLSISSGIGGNNGAVVLRKV